MLASVNALNSPETRCAEDGSIQCAEGWEMRQMDIIEATPRNATNAGGGAKIDIDVDTEAWFPSSCSTSTGASGELYQTSIYWLAPNRGDRTTKRRRGCGVSI